MKNIIDKVSMSLVISRFMSTAITHIQDTGHNVADREMNEALFSASVADTEVKQKLAISRLVRDVVPFISEKGKAIDQVKVAINDLVDIDNKIKGIVPLIPAQEKKLMNIVIENFLKFGCGNIKYTGHNAADREINEALQLARNATTPSEQTRAIKALIKDVLPFISSEGQQLSKSYQAISDLQHMGIKINKRALTKDNDDLSI